MLKLNSNLVHKDNCATRVTQSESDFKCEASELHMSTLCTSDTHMNSPSTSKPRKSINKDKSKDKLNSAKSIQESINLSNELDKQVESLDEVKVNKQKN